MKFSDMPRQPPANMVHTDQRDPMEMIGGKPKPQVIDNFVEVPFTQIGKEIIKLPNVIQINQAADAQNQAQTVEDEKPIIQEDESFDGDWPSACPVIDPPSPLVSAGPGPQPPGDQCCYGNVLGESFDGERGKVSTTHLCTGDETIPDSSQHDPQNDVVVSNATSTADGMTSVGNTPDESFDGELGKMPTEHLCTGDQMIPGSKQYVPDESFGGERDEMPAAHPCTADGMISVDNVLDESVKCECGKMPNAHPSDRAASSVLPGSTPSNRPSDDENFFLGLGAVFHGSHLPEPPSCTSESSCRPAAPPREQADPSRGHAWPTTGWSSKPSWVQEREAAERIRQEARMRAKLLRPPGLWS
jgi:hypothetical protein